MPNDACYCLYVHTVPNGKRYVGITSKTPQDRWKNGSGYRRSYFERAIRKYGWDRIRHDVLRDDLSREKAISMEKELIRILKTTDRNCGYNISSGGEVPPNSIESFEYKLKQSLNTHKQWETKKAKHHNGIPPLHLESKYRKAVYQYDDNGTLLNVFKSVHEAAKQLGVCVMSVSEACNKDGRKCKGFKLRFEKEEYKTDGIQGSWSARQVIQLDIQGAEIHRFKSATEAARFFGKNNSSTILDACTGRGITAYGYMWRFA